MYIKATLCPSDAKPLTQAAPIPLAPPLIRILIDTAFRVNKFLHQYYTAYKEKFQDVREK